MDDSDTSDSCGVGIRGVAMTIDSFVWMGLFVVAGLAVGVATGQVETAVNGADVDLDGTPAQVSLVVWLTLATGYHTLFEWQFGKTIGKYLVGIRVTAADGSAPSLVDVLLRNIGRLVDWLPLFYIVGIVAVVISEQNKRLGDQLGETAVIRE